MKSAVKSHSDVHKSVFVVSNRLTLRILLKSAEIRGFLINFRQSALFLFEFRKAEFWQFILLLNKDLLLIWDLVLAQVLIVSQQPEFVLIGPVFKQQAEWDLGHRFHLRCGEVSFLFLLFFLLSLFLFVLGVD